MASDPAAVATLPTAVRAAYEAAERAGQRVRLGNVPEFGLVVLGPTDAGKTALVSALLSDAVGGFPGLAERPGRGTITPVEYVYGSPPALWLGVGGAWAEPADWIQVDPATPDFAPVPDLRRVRVEAPAEVLHEWNIRIVDCPGLDSLEDLTGPVMDEARRPGVGVVYVVPRRGITEIDAQALETLRHVPTVLIENRRDAEIVSDPSSVDELAVDGLNTGLAVPIAARRLGRPGPERESLRRCVALLRTRTAPVRWASSVHASAIRSRDALRADFARRQAMALMARHPDWIGSLHLLADLIGIERDGPGLIDLTDRLTEVARLADDAQPAPSLRTLIDRDVRSTIDRYNVEAARDRRPRPPRDDRPDTSARFAQSYAEIRDDLVTILDDVLADAALRATRTDRTALSSTRAGVLADRLEIAVLGQFSSGKSSLINALLGVGSTETLLPTSPRPTTATVNQVEYSPHPSLSVTWLSRVDLRLLSPGAEPNQVRVHLDEIRALGRWLRDRTVLARDCSFHPLSANRGRGDGEAAFWRLWKTLDVAGTPQLYAYLTPSRDKPRLTDLSVPGEVSVRRFAATPDQWPGALSREGAFADLADDPALALRVDTLRLGFPHPLLKHVTIVDTPGTDAPVPHHRITAHRAVRDKRQCAVVYCFDGAQPASGEDRANLSFLREGRIGNTDLARFFFAITRKGVAERDERKVRETVRETLAAAGAGSPRTYFTEVVTELNGDFRALSDDLDRFILGSKGALLRSWTAHARRVVQDVHDRHARRLDDLTESERDRQARLESLHTEAAILSAVQTGLVTSAAWGEPWLRGRISTAAGVGLDRIDREIGGLVNRRAFQRARGVLAGAIERLNEVTRLSVEDSCAQTADRLVAELARRLPGRRISPLELNLTDEFFASAEVDYAVGAVSWRSGWERFKGLFGRGRRGRESDSAANRQHLADVWALGRDQGERRVTRTVDGHLDQLQSELARLADGIAAEIVAAARAPSAEDGTIATAGRDRALTWLQRLDALGATRSGGDS